MSRLLTQVARSHQPLPGRRLPLSRSVHPSASRLDAPTWPPPPVPQPAVTPSDAPPFPSRPITQPNSFWRAWANSASFQAALTTVVGLAMVFGAGVGYLEWYKHHVLHRMERAFAGGYDPALEISTLHTPDSSHIHRKEQPVIDSILRGDQAGGYYLMIGPKGTGKGTMILDAMRAVKAEGASVCEAHPDLEVFRLRLGKSLDFDYYEDWQGSLFSRADPRVGGPALDVERAMTKLEKVALRYARKHGRPLVLAFNNIHLFPNTPEGHAVLHQLQQRAEAWAEAGILTMIFSTDDFWCLDTMKKNASRMRILSVYDLPAHESISALGLLRRHALSHRLGIKAQDVELEGEDVLRGVYDMVGGRTSYLARVARADDMLAEARGMIQAEKGWLLSKVGLIPEMDDDVMDEQKWSSCSWLLLRHFAQQVPPLRPPGAPLAAPATSDGVDADADAAPTLDTVDGSELESHQGSGGDLIEPTQVNEDLDVSAVSYDEARRIMTRADFLEGLDHANSR
ncbi:hypothetical protein Q5752_003679 [Cryptotrichosporon argae]